MKVGKELRIFFYTTSPSPSWSRAW